MHTRKWHTNLLILFLAGYSLVWLVGVTVLIVTAPAPVDQADCALFLWTGALVGWAAFLLFRQSRYQSLPLFILPWMYGMTAIRLSNGRLSFVNWQMNLRHLLDFPSGYRICAAFFLVCAIYALFLDTKEAA